MINWDYKLKKNWLPTTNEEWEWFLVRKINYGDLHGIKREVLGKYFGTIKKHLDPGKRFLLEEYFKSKQS